MKRMVEAYEALIDKKDAEIAELREYVARLRAECFNCGEQLQRLTSTHNMFHADQSTVRRTKEKLFELGKPMWQHLREQDEREKAKERSS